MRGLAEAGAVWGPLKRQKQLEIHPPEKILECAKREWDEWRKSLNKMGYENTPDSWRYFSQFFLNKNKVEFHVLVFFFF